MIGGTGSRILDQFFLLPSIFALCNTSFGLITHPLGVPFWMHWQAGRFKDVSSFLILPTMRFFLVTLFARKYGKPSQARVTQYYHGLCTTIPSLKMSQENASKTALPPPCAQQTPFEHGILGGGRQVGILGPKLPDHILASLPANPFWAGAQVGIWNLHSPSGHSVSFEMRCIAIRLCSKSKDGPSYQCSAFSALYFAMQMNVVCTEE